MTIVERLSNRFKSILPKESFRDILFLLIVISLSRILFVFQIGFYSDDWSFLELLYFDNMNIWENYRPGYLLSWKLLYSFFGLSPEGYHLINTLIFYSNAILLYLILKKLKLPRLFVLSIPLLFIIIPHYSTFHFWASVIPNHFCLVMCLGSLLLDLKALESPFPKFLIWKLLSIISIVVSVFTYELFLPFFYFNLVIVFYYFRKLKTDAIDKNDISGKKLVWFLITNFVFLKIALSYKLFFTITSVRMMGSEMSFTEHIYYLFLNAIRLDYSKYDYGFNIFQSLKTAFVEYGIQLPEKLITIYNYYPDSHILIVSLILALIIFIYIYKAVRNYDIRIFSLKTFSMMLLIGLVLFFVGYSIFFTNYSIAFTTTGIANRVSIGASLGIAVILIALITGICLFIKNKNLRSIFFSLAFTGLCVSGFIINTTISYFWIKADQAENEILTEIKNQFPTLPDSTRFMLDGVCPYIGPAIVFESNWDLAGAMRIAYAKKDLKADIITPGLVITEEGLVTSLYEEKYFYPYDILIYNYSEKKSFLISDMDNVIKYFKAVDSNYNGGCSYGHEAHGVEIF